MMGCGCGKKKGPKVAKQPELKPVVSWRAYCTGGRVYDSRQHRAQDIADAVLVLVGYEGGEYKHVHAGVDWYFIAGEYVGCLAEFVDTPEQTAADAGLWLPPKPILERFPTALLKRGVWTTDAEYEQVRKQAQESEWPSP